MVAIAVGLLFAFWPMSEAATSVSPPSDVMAQAQTVADSTTTSDSTVVTSTTEPPPIRITIAAVGDVVGVESIRIAAWDSDAKDYDFYPMLKPLEPYLAGADYAVCNLETRLADPSAGGYEGQLILNSPASLGEALKQAGFDLCALANNHSLDKGFEGIVQTIDRLDAIGLANIGCYRSDEDKRARSPFIVDIKGIKVAFINYTDINNGLYLAPQHRSYAVNFLGTEAAVAEAQAAREAGAEVVIMIVHWGKEKMTEQNGTQTRLAQGSGDYQGLLERGIDVILGAHPHVVQPAAKVTYQTEAGPRDGYVVYSLGNFLPPASVPWPEDGGLIAYVHVEKLGDETKVTGLSFLPTLRQVLGSGSDKKVRMLPVLPGLTPTTDYPIADVTRARMDKAWNYYQAMYDKPQDNIVPFPAADLSITEQ